MTRARKPPHVRPRRRGRLDPFPGALRSSGTHALGKPIAPGHLAWLALLPSFLPSFSRVLFRSRSCVHSRFARSLTHRTAGSIIRALLVVGPRARPAAAGPPIRLARCPVVRLHMITSQSPSPSARLPTPARPSVRLSVRARGCCHHRDSPSTGRAPPTDGGSHFDATLPLTTLTSAACHPSPSALSVTTAVASPRAEGGSRARRRCESYRYRI